MAIKDNGTIKSMIKVMRDKGMTYQEIADKLEKEYGIVRTRQAIYGMYSRATDEAKEMQSEEKQKIVSHVINIYCLGLDMTKTTLAVQNLGLNVSYNKVSRIIHSNPNYIKSVNDTLIAKVKDLISAEDDPSIIKAKLSYCGIEISNKKFQSLICTACKIRVRDYIIKEATSAYKLTRDKEVVKSICYSYPESNIQISDIEQNMIP